MFPIRVIINSVIHIDELVYYQPNKLKKFKKQPCTSSKTFYRVVALKPDNTSEKHSFLTIRTFYVIH